jgi:DNA invertase Pin-like site-specific DNA recombinase
VFREVASGGKTDRAQLRRAVAQLDAGDVLIVTRLDRLARSTRDLLNTLATIAGQGAGFRSLGDKWADTTTPHGRLMLTVLGGLAEFERELIRARTSEGRARQGARREARPHAEAHGSPAARGDQATQQRRNRPRHRAQLQQPQHHFEVNELSPPVSSKPPPRSLFTQPGHNLLPAITC